MTVRVDGAVFSDVHYASDYVRAWGVPDEDVEVRDVSLEGVPLGDGEHEYVEVRQVYRIGGVPYEIVWEMPPSIEGTPMEDWPWDNGTARVVVDGCHVTEGEER